jgi:DNA-binding transcriptional ArsR family regulator
MNEKSSSQLDVSTAARVAELFRSFSDASRVNILYALMEQELNVGSLARLVGISESAVSHQLRSLRQMGIVTARRDGKEVHYRIEDEHILALFRQGINHVRHG